MNLQGRNLLKETDLSAAEFLYLVDLGGQLRLQKRMGLRNNRLAGRNIALIFEKTSTRTRIAGKLAAESGAQLLVTADVLAAVAGKPAAIGSQTCGRRGATKAGPLPSGIVQALRSRRRRRRPDISSRQASQVARCSSTRRRAAESASP